MTDKGAYDGGLDEQMTERGALARGVDEQMTESLAETGRGRKLVGRAQGDADVNGTVGHKEVLK